MQKSESIAELAKALSAFQGELSAAPKDSANPFFHSRYADLATVWETCRGPLAKHGLAVSQLPTIEAERITLDTILMHTSGEWLLSSLLLTPMRERKDVGWVASMDPQSVGSAITYARRYALCAILGVVADDDDDAEAAMGRPAEPSAARMPQAMAVAPKGLCPTHHVPFVHRQGTSKGGAPFDFWSCPQKLGTGYCKERPKEDSPGDEAPVEHTGVAADTTISKTTVQPPPPSAAPAPSGSSDAPPGQAATPTKDITQELFLKGWQQAGLPDDFKTPDSLAWRLFQAATGFDSIGAARAANVRYDTMLRQCCAYSEAKHEPEA